ncbi:hypothetical protein [Candidatus Colwellia aromaticivorans]|uniref:hypothetical protein n=1 Tax=Candidatus Colwellia aromaticivorans TaxID=2267621 RepID=UPI000DF45A6B|nr:hypothetical protein [Candidatus Colwellia aromaticivorans]
MLHGCSLLDNAGAYCPEQLVIEINALYLTVFPTYKIDHLINETGITQHYRLNQSLNNKGPLTFISERERQVCQGILRGEKMEAVSAEVGIATSSAILIKKSLRKAGHNQSNVLVQSVPQKLAS